MEITRIVKIDIFLDKQNTLLHSLINGETMGNRFRCLVMADNEKLSEFSEMILNQVSHIKNLIIIKLDLMNNDRSPFDILSDKLNGFFFKHFSILSIENIKEILKKNNLKVLFLIYNFDLIYTNEQFLNTHLLSDILQIGNCDESLWQCYLLSTNKKLETVCFKEIFGNKKNNNEIKKNYPNFKYFDLNYTKFQPYILI